jgi:dUTP pyrophosphatase
MVVLGVPQGGSVNDDSMFVPTRRAPIRIKLLSPTAKAPKYMTAGAAGADVFVDLRHRPDDIEVWSHETVKVPLGFAIEIPPGWVGLLKGRSGLAAMGHDAHVAAIDPDYRGEVCMLIHGGQAPFVIKHGDRVGQLLLVPAPQYEFRVVDELSETVRGVGGFGHTGSR